MWKQSKSAKNHAYFLYNKILNPVWFFHFPVYNSRTNFSYDFLFYLKSLFFSISLHILKAAHKMCPLRFINFLLNAGQMELWNCNTNAFMEAIFTNFWSWALRNESNCWMAKNIWLRNKTLNKIIKKTFCKYVKVKFYFQTS